ncbi:hypothetical protein EJF18_30177 [Clavispora lusitaniae]|uniref:Uncharacterized protein n=1 Tax=Clavispora lusitaniae TaxID=36911 RepID=A0ACD0WI90_CLALS|nr:hypothetical protein EJF14_30177 [Clavispora lusitaniae]QFZ33478.1 hypothetical protein EJF16_30177 [Clavispora lusitaniae]QFZ39149.1 hypothetical protein EJF15_30177 [Clavispora lusitaniae]QFZ44831.1 hypothetical protein EJF18_30177 [Clavispora lusitaniae]QFZ50508.1 hypothetical protein EJF17_30177 [Clavispora lusitaniae]
MGATKTPMQQSSSLRASTSMAAHASVGSTSNSPPPSFAKYAKIQPAIAIKPKPSTPSPSVKTAFNPHYDPSSSSSATLLHEEAINTSRKWILPPRPRPGRKPSAQTAAADERKAACKKKPKMSRLTKPDSGDSGNSAPLSAKMEGSASMNSMSSAMSISSSSFSQSDSKPSSSSMSTQSHGSSSVSVAPAIDTTSRPTLQPAPRQATDLRSTYLARLKEQELIRNYIEVLTNQIKELRFVQSGVITVDALDSSSRTSPKIAVPQTVEQLDQINNIHDLDRFVAHLTTQSNVIHSVTKKLTSGTGSQGPGLQSQIRYYLELRAKHRATGTPRAPPPRQAVAPPIAAAPKPGFTPSLLRPLKMNLFDSEDDVIDVDIINDGDSLLDRETGRARAPDEGLSEQFGDTSTKETLPFLTKDKDGKTLSRENLAAFNRDNISSLSRENLLALGRDTTSFSRDNFGPQGQDFFATDRLKLEESAAPDILGLAGEVRSERKSRKMVCGFCNTETPCLCFDADNIFGE